MNYCSWKDKKIKIGCFYSMSIFRLFYAEVQLLFLITYGKKNEYS